MSENTFFSDRSCACGCNNLLPKTIADRGWKYLRGHKPEGLLKSHGTAAHQTGQRPSSRTAFGKSVSREDAGLILRGVLLQKIGKAHEAEAELQDLTVRTGTATQALKEAVGEAHSLYAALRVVSVSHLDDEVKKAYFGMPVGRAS